MSVSVSCSLAHVEQGRSTCNVSRSLSVELFCFAACVCHVCLLRFLARSLTSSKDDRPAMSVAISPASIFASQRVSVTAPNRRELCRSLYVCFGFSLARLRGARTIDLQCQSLSLCRAFCFAACVCQCAEVSRVMPFAGQLARKINRKSPRKSIKNRSS